LRIQFLWGKEGWGELCFMFWVSDQH
jgi:hypothetical protein